MRGSTHASTVVSFVTVLSLAACDGSAEAPRDSVDQGASPAVTPLRFNREFIFVGSVNDPLVVAPFTFRSTDDGTQLHRVAQAWLARGETWDRFLDATAVTSRAGGVWRVVPVGDLSIIAGGPSELETLRYSRAERRLRLDLGAPQSDWSQGGDTRFRLVDGSLSIGTETIAGPVLEMLRVESTADDGWPSPQDFDTLFLISGDSLRLVIADGPDASEPSYGWLWTPVEEQVWDSGEIRRIEMRPLQEARRDVPWVWGFRIDAAGLSGEIEAIGSDALLGPERGGRRAVEVRFSVSGWVEIDGASWPVTGMIRHTQQ